MMKIKKGIIITVSIVLIIAIIGKIAMYYFDPHSDNVRKLKETLPIETRITKDMAISDLTYLVNMIEKHHVSSNKQLKSTVRQQYDKEVKNMIKDPTVLYVRIAASRILNKLQDAHSRCDVNNTGVTKKLDANFDKISTDLYCTFSDNTKVKVLSINKAKVKELYKTFLEQFSYENEYHARNKFGEYLQTPEGLRWLGVILIKNDGVDIEYEENGQSVVKHVLFVDANKADKSNVKNQEFKIDQSNNVGIFTLNQCVYDDEYKNTLKEFFSKVKESKVGNIAIDLRENGGGNSEVIDEFMKYLNVDKYNEYGSREKYANHIFNNKITSIKNNKYNDLLFNGQLYVLTSNDTFSSAMMFSVVIGDNKLGKIIGEPSGNKPSSYGDVLKYQLPYSKLVFTTTYKYFIRPDSTKESDAYQEPDYKVESSKAVEKLYEVIKG